MRDFIKLSLMTVSGFFIAVIIYPFVHECGHSVAALLVGAKVIDSNSLPLPSVLSNIGGLNYGSIVFIGLSGLLLPFIISIIPLSKNFLLWYMGMLFRGIVLISMGISTIITVLYMLGTRAEDDDITKALDSWCCGEIWVLLGTALCVVVLIIQIKNEHPIKRIIYEFKY